MKLFVVAAKELLLVRRDRAGLIVLFIMPAVLVMIITLVQENVMKLTGQQQISLVVLDKDKGSLGDALRHRLQAAHLNAHFLAADAHGVDEVQSAVAAGTFQVALIIPRGTSADIAQKAAQLIARQQQPEDMSSTPLLLFFDPAIMPSVRNSLRAQLNMAAELFSLQAKIRLLQKTMADTLSDLGGESSPFPPDFLQGFIERPLIALDEGKKNSPETGGHPPYNPVQQNVPAWALFGMFFTAIPLAGSLLQERHSGILARLSSAPVAPVSLFLGKVIAYIGICLCQFLLICLIGIYLFPLFDLPAFTITGQIINTLLVVLCSGMAASSYGLFLGSVCSTYEQASTVGATTIVSAAAIGGIMVPVYAMPEIMQQVSLVSPLNWGVNAFQELLVRGNGLGALYPDLGRMAAFFLGLSVCSWWLAVKKTRL